MRIFDVVPPSCANDWHDILNRTRQHGSMTFESRLCSRDGHEFPVEVYANFIEVYGNSYYTISARDITGRMQAEQGALYGVNSTYSSRRDHQFNARRHHYQLEQMGGGAVRLYCGRDHWKQCRHARAPRPSE
jgi:hypothetical protein